jgi:hypothetical protein
VTFDLEPLLAAFPQWRDLVAHDRSAHGAYLVLRVEAPAAAETEHGLLIHTDNDEITISFDYYHAHFDSWNEFNGTQATDSALEFVRCLVGEEVAVLSWWWNDQWQGSAHVEVPGDVAPPSWANAGSWNRVRVRSWNGTHNRESAA